MMSLGPSRTIDETIGTLQVHWMWEVKDVRRKGHLDRGYLRNLYLHGHHCVR
jgi:hypothetical protein